MTEQVLKTYLDEYGFMRTSIHGSIGDDRMAQLEADIVESQKVVLDAFNKTNTKFKNIVDASGFSGDFTPRAIPILAEFTRSNKPYVEKIAGFGAGKTATLAANVITALSGRSDITFFPTEQEAVAWLQKD